MQPSQRAHLLHDEPQNDPQIQRTHIDRMRLVHDPMQWTQQLAVFPLAQSYICSRSQGLHAKYMCIDNLISSGWLLSIREEKERNPPISASHGKNRDIWWNWTVGKILGRFAEIYCVDLFSKLITGWARYSRVRISSMAAGKRSATSAILLDSNSSNPAYESRCVHILTVPSCPEEIILLDLPEPHIYFDITAQNASKLTRWDQIWCHQRNNTFHQYLFHKSACSSGRFSWENTSLVIVEGVCDHIVDKCVLRKQVINICCYATNERKKSACLDRHGTPGDYYQYYKDLVSLEALDRTHFRFMLRCTMNKRHIPPFSSASPPDAALFK